MRTICTWWRRGGRASRSGRTASGCVRTGPGPRPTVPGPSHQAPGAGARVLMAILTPAAACRTAEARLTEARLTVVRTVRRRDAARRWCALRRSRAVRWRRALRWRRAVWWRLGTFHVPLPTNPAVRDARRSAAWRNDSRHSQSRHGCARRCAECGPGAGRAGAGQSRRHVGPSSPGTSAVTAAAVRRCAGPAGRVSRSAPILGVG